MGIRWVERTRPASGWTRRRPTATSRRRTRFTVRMDRPRTSRLRRTAGALALAGLLAGLLAGAAPAGAATPDARLSRTLRTSLRAAGPFTGALVVDLDAGRTLYAARAGVRRIPASVEKLYTTSSALLAFGAGGRLRTRVLGAGTLEPGGTWRGDLYLRGAGDPTFGSSAYARRAYGSRASARALAAGVAAAGVRRVSGRVLGAGTLTYDRVASRRYATERVVGALRSAGVRVARGRTGTGTVPSGAEALTGVASPTVATLIRLTNVPSDNFLADTLLRALGTGPRGVGTYARGAAAVWAQLAPFGLRPVVADGSGYSRANRTSPAEVVELLRSMADDAAFRGSLAVAGRSGTLAGRMRGTSAQGRCRGKTGTLSDVSNLAGYCRARNGDTLAFAILMNGVVPVGARRLQDRIAVAIARYDGAPAAGPAPSPSGGTGGASGG